MKDQANLNQQQAVHLSRIGQKMNIERQRGPNEVKWGIDAYRKPKSVHRRPKGTHGAGVHNIFSLILKTCKFGNIR